MLDSVQGEGGALGPDSSCFSSWRLRILAWRRKRSRCASVGTARAGSWAGSAPAASANAAGRTTRLAAPKRDRPRSIKGM